MGSEMCIRDRLTTLSDQMGRIFSRDELLDHVYPGHRIVNDRTIDSHIKNLRKKMKAIAPDIELIQSVYGVGYKIERLMQGHPVKR